jgi:redox-sensing transcriptional repressor
VRHLTIGAKRMTIQKTARIPRKTLERLLIYYRILCNLADNGQRRIKSHELGQATQIDPSTIRRDFSCFGELGRSGYGYDIAHLLRILGEILEVDEPQLLGLVGVGNLGRALLKNNFRRNPNISIVCAFDADPAIIGQTIDEVTVQPMSELAATLAVQQINTVISTVPSHSLQAVADLLVNNGVRSILSFAPEPIILPAGIHMRYLDLTSEVLNLLLLSEDKIALKTP